MKVAPDTLPNAPPRRAHRARKAQPLTRAHIDGRTNAYKVFNRIVAGIEGDLGGAGELSTVERTLVEAFAGSAVVVNDLNARIAMGHAIDLTDHAAAISGLVRIASRIGIRRRSKDITPLHEYIDDNMEETIIENDG